MDITKLVPSLLVLAACFCFYILRQKEIKYKSATIATQWFVFCSGIYFFGEKLLYRLKNPEIWDFSSFYIWGKVAVKGQNFYLPENSEAVYNFLNLPFLKDKVFFEEIIKVGFLYPPPTMLYFAPLGLLSYKTAMIIWTFFNLIFFVASLKIIYDLFFKAKDINGLILITSIALLLSPVRATVFFSQTNFIVLFFLLMMKKYQGSPYGGVFLCLAMFTKPYMAIFFVYFLIIRNKRAILYFFTTAIALSLLSVLLFGYEVFLSYFLNNPVKRLPEAVYFEDINQSLHSVLLRAGLINSGNSLTFMVVSFLIIIISAVFLFFLYKKKYFDTIWVTLLLCGLIIYPATLSYYGVLCLFIIPHFFDEKSELFLNPSFGIIIVTATIFLCTINFFSALIFLSAVVFFKTKTPGFFTYDFIPVFSYYLRKPKS